MPKFAIVIPTHDSLQTLRQAVESALGQDYDDFAVVVSDNASLDGTREYLADLRLGGSPRLYCAQWNEERLQKSSNWNRAISLAPQCEYVILLHSDDILYPDCLRNLASAIGAERTRPACAFGNHDQLSVDGMRKRGKRQWPWKYCVAGNAANVLFATKNTASIVGLAFRWDVFKRLNGFAEGLTYMQDLDFIIQAGASGGALYVPKKFGCYRDAPVRPGVVPKWTIEEARFLLEMTKPWPRFFRHFVITARTQFNLDRLKRENPEALPSVEAQLREMGIRLTKLRLTRSLLIVSQIQKMFFSITTNVIK